MPSGRYCDRHRGADDRRSRSDGGTRNAECPREQRQLPHVERLCRQNKRGLRCRSGSEHARQHRVGRRTRRNDRAERGCRQRRHLGAQCVRDGDQRDPAQRGGQRKRQQSGAEKARRRSRIARVLRSAIALVAPAAAHKPPPERSQTRRHQSSCDPRLQESCAEDRVGREKRDRIARGRPDHRERGEGRRRASDEPRVSVHAAIAARCDHRRQCRRDRCRGEARCQRSDERADKDIGSGL